MSKKKTKNIVSQRPVLDLDSFDIDDPKTYDGVEVLRGMNKLTKPYFKENEVAIKHVSKSFQGKTLTIPYVERDGERYWMKKKNNSKLTA